MELIEEIKSVVNEELGISDLVTKTTESLISQIVNHQKQLPYTLKSKEGFFATKLFGKEITIMYTVYFLDDEEEYNALDLFNPATLSNDLKKLRTTICYVKSLNKYVDYAGSTQHEIEHLYQAIKSKNFPNLKPKTSEIYDTAMHLIGSSDWYKQVVGYVIYYNNKFEKNAFGNEIYRSLVDNPHKKPLDIVKESSVYININVIQQVLNNLTPFRMQYFENVLSHYFNKHFNWWLNMAKKVVKNYMITIGKAIAKYEKDIHDENALGIENKNALNPYEETNFKFINDNSEKD